MEEKRRQLTREERVKYETNLKKLEETQEFIEYDIFTIENFLSKYDIIKKIKMKQLADTKLKNEQALEQCKNAINDNNSIILEIKNKLKHGVVIKNKKEEN